MNISSSESPDNIVTAYFERYARWWAIAILLLMFGLAITSMANKAPTFDEQGFIVRGLGYLRGYQHIRVGHPLGLNLFSASMLASDAGVNLPLNDPSWTGTSFHRPAELFLWEIGNDVRHIMFLARLPTIWLGLLLAALASRWARDVSGRVWPGLLALLFIALDPNILAHMRLATTDLGLTAFSLLAGYTLWRFLKAPTWRNAILSGAAMGLLQNTKFTAILFIPLFALVVLIGLVQMWIDNRHTVADSDSVWSAVPWRALLMMLLLYPLVALFTLWAAYGFEIGTMPVDLPMLSILSGKTLPLAHHLEQLLDIGGRLRVGTPSFLLGQYGDRGWWYYFPVTFFLKTPLPTLILLSWGVVTSIYCLIRYRQRGMCLSVLNAAALLIPAIGYFIIALTTDINLGYRHILPVLPFVIVFAAGSLSKVIIENRIKWRIIPAIVLSVWLAIVSLLIYPDYLAYFNVLADGPNNGWRSLVDSNLDWGQDLDDLPIWMEENKVEKVWLSYFGEARPEYYGIEYQGLDSFPPRLMDPQKRPFFPTDPAPGIYAISATNLQGVHFTNHDQFSWFREQEPIDKLGYSIFLYQVPVRGEPVSLLLSGIQMDEIQPQDFAAFGTNDIQPRWVDLSQSLILPSDKSAWLVTDSAVTLHPALAPYLHGLVVVDNHSTEYQMAHYDVPEIPEDIVAEFTKDNGRVRLREATSSMDSNTNLTLVTIWEQVGEPTPLKIFVHVIGSDGQIISQWDGLGAAWEGWRTGDDLIQVHEFVLPQGLQTENYKLIAGIYDPDTGQRWVSGQALDQVELELPE